MKNVLFVDFGTADKVRLRNIEAEAVARKILSVAGSGSEAILVKMRAWGLNDTLGKGDEAKNSLEQLVFESVIGLPGTVMAGVAMTEGRVDL